MAKMALVVVAGAAIVGAVAFGIACLLITQAAGQARGGEMLFIGFVTLAGWLVGACLGLVLAVRLFWRRRARASEGEGSGRI
ncbi:hypothetical protein [Paracoccus albicereus]|nr:hypothetical protein [Paracoccus albicereus]